MRRFLLIAPALWVSTTVFASSFASFTGGRGDGYAHGDFITPRPVAAVIHFLGGGRDGYSSSIWRTYQPATLPSQARFAGSGCDGYGSSRMLSSWWQTKPAQARFAGNGYDGYASSKQLSSWSQTKPKRFSGGSFDGYDRAAVLNLLNWSLGDTDANGLPDWWELKYFGVLTGTDLNADPDHDGAPNLFEYLTGTNPTNASSYFHITRLAPGSPNKIFVYGEPSYFYTLQRADDPALDWINVSNQSRVPTASEGELEMDDNFRGAGGFYRVLSEH